MERKEAVATYLVDLAESHSAKDSYYSTPTASKKFNDSSHGGKADRDGSDREDAASGAVRGAASAGAKPAAASADVSPAASGAARIVVKLKEVHFSTYRGWPKEAVTWVSSEKAKRRKRRKRAESGQWLPAASGASASSCLWRFCPFPSGSSSGLLRVRAEKSRVHYVAGCCCCSSINAAEAAPRAVPSRAPSSSSSSSSSTSVVVVLVVVFAVVLAVVAVDFVVNVDAVADVVADADADVEDKTLGKLDNTPGRLDKSLRKPDRTLGKPDNNALGKLDQTLGKLDN